VQAHVDGSSSKLGLDKGLSRARPARVRRPRPDGPRERLLARGAEDLTDAELLSIVLGTGLPGVSAVDLARELIQRHQGVAPLLAAPAARLITLRGLGPARAAQLKAATELIRRAMREQMVEREILSSPHAVRDYLKLSLSALPHEVFVVLFLDSQHRLLVAEELFRGTLTQTSVYPREVVKAALGHNAAAVILAHNHPSGVAEPSRADELLTQALKQALALVDVRTLDHFVVAGNRIVSFAERGLIA
jgi:DNA repair protein RadC